MIKNYTLNDKKQLANKIKKIKKKKYLKKIATIILDHKGNYIENDNGLFMFFHNLENETYVELDKCVSNIQNKINKKLNKKKESPMSDTTYEPYITNDLLKNHSLLKLSNAEKNIIKRKAYDIKLEKNSKSTNMSNYSFSKNNSDTISDDNNNIKINIEKT